MALTVAINYGLNLYWLHIINKQVYKIITGRGEDNESLLNRKEENDEERTPMLES